MGRPRRPFSVFKFASQLVEGVIESRPNRFVMFVRIAGAEGELERCHCPCTGAIGPIRFEEVPCLLSPNTSEKGKTRFTVEAIGLHAPGETTQGKNKDRVWYGINQNRVNRYVEALLRAGALEKAVPGAANGTVEREKKVGTSRIDFVVNGNHFVEVKAPMVSMPVEGHRLHTPRSEKQRAGTITERLIRHYKDLGSAGADRKTVLLTFMYPAARFKPKPPTSSSGILAERLKELMTTLLEAERCGVDTWQLNLLLTKDGISLGDLFPLKLFDDPGWVILQQAQEQISNASGEGLTRNGAFEDFRASQRSVCTKPPRPGRRSSVSDAGDDEKGQNLRRSKRSKR